MAAINGYKTYIVAALTALYAISGFLTGNVDANTAMQFLTAAAGMATIRHGVAKPTV